MEEKIRRAGQVKGLSAKLRFPDIIGKSRIMREAVLRAQRFAATDETILITGESGTGKEVFAQSIHNASARRTHPFLAVNCSAISPSLLESELFGYAEGAFTGARRGGKQGMFELAHQGTIFLDEIGSSRARRRAPAAGAAGKGGDARRRRQDHPSQHQGHRRNEPAPGKGRAEGAFSLGPLPPAQRPAAQTAGAAGAPRGHPCFSRQLHHPVVLQPAPRQQIREALARHEARLMGYPWPGNIRELQNLLRRVMALVGTMEGDHVEQEIRELLAETFANPLALQPPIDGVVG